MPSRPAKDEIPEVSVVMPVWNCEPYLAAAIASVQAQTFAAWELLLIDDGSRDASLRIALDYAEADPERIHILRHAGGGNRGSSASRNLGLRQARGRLLTFLDADDVWLPHCLATQIETLGRQPKAAMVFGAAERWCEPEVAYDEAAARRAWWGANYIPPVQPEGAALGMLTPGTLLDWYLPDESKVPCICSVMLRTEAARAVGGFEEQFCGLYDDQALHAKISLRYPVVAYDACLARYRQRPDSCCAEGRGDDALQNAARKKFLHWLERYRRATCGELESEAPGTVVPSRKG